MNKKTYLAPVVCTTLLQTDALLYTGSSISSKDPNIPFGGIDNGTNMPGSRPHYSVWKEEEEEMTIY